MTEAMVDQYQQTLFAVMDPKTGQFKAELGPIPCLRCGKPLNADGGHPAETYLGTYNGLCYPCTNESAYVAATFVLDGARKVSWPPHCPSWRRDRETFYGFSDCETCRGLGVGWTQHHMGASMRHQCTACLERFNAQRDPHLAREQRIRAAAQRRYEDRLVAAKLGTRAKKTGKFKPGPRVLEDADPEVTAIRLAVLADAERLLAAAARRKVRLRLWEVE